MLGSTQKFRLAVLVVIASAFFYLLAVTWLKWGGLLIDTFREIWLPSLLLKGYVLYKDIAYECGILPPYFLAFLYRIFGTNLYTLIGFGIVIASASCLVVYRLSRLFLDRVVSTLVVLNFLFIFAFNNRNFTGIFNFILPYSVASVMFVFFVLWAGYFLLKFIERKEIRYLYFWSIALLLMILSRPMMSITVWFVFLALAAAYVLIEKSDSKWNIFLFLCLPVCISVAIYAIFFAMTGSFPAFREMVIDYVLRLGKLGQYHYGVFGTIGFIDNIRNIFVSFLSQVLIVLLFGVATYCIMRFFLQEKKTPFFVFFGVSLVFVIFFCFTLLLVNVQYSCVPLTLFFIFGYSVFGLIKQPSQRTYFFQLMALSALSLVLMLRILVVSNPTTHGFCFLVLGMISYFVFFFRLFDDYFSWRIKQFPVYLFNVILSWFMIMMLIPQWMTSAYLYSNKRLTIDTGKGVFMAYPDDTSVGILETINYLRNNVPAGKKISVFPEGASMYFLSGLDPACRYYNIFPELFNQLGDERVLAMFSQASPDYVVILQRNTGDHGAASFGIDYAQTLYAWILKNYTLIQQFGPYPFTSPAFGTAVFKRKT